MNSQFEMIPPTGSPLKSNSMSMYLPCNRYHTYLTFNKRRKHNIGFIQDFFLGVGNVDACNRRMRVLIHPLGFVETLDIFKNKNHRIQLKAIIMLYFVIVLYTLL